MTDGAKVDGDFVGFNPNGPDMEQMKRKYGNCPDVPEVPVEQRPIKSLVQDMKEAVNEGEMSPDDIVLIAVVEEGIDPTNHEAMLRNSQIYTGVRVSGIGNINDKGKIDKYMVLFAFKESPKDED